MNKYYVDKICLLFYIARSLIVILKNCHQQTLVYYIDKTLALALLNSY
jgi:hypothetical protein